MYGQVSLTTTSHIHSIPDMLPGGWRPSPGPHEKNSCGHSDKAKSATEDLSNDSSSKLFEGPHPRAPVVSGAPPMTWFEPNAKEYSHLNFPYPAHEGIGGSALELGPGYWST